MIHQNQLHRTSKLLRAGPLRILSASVIALLCVLPAAQGGRMMDSDTPTAPPPTTEAAAATQPADPAVVEDGDEAAEGSKAEPEPTEDADPEMEAEPAPPTLPIWWKWKMRLDLSSIYDDNLFITSSHKQSDEIVRVRADLGLTLGDYFYKQESFLTLGYAPSILMFQKHSNLNSTEQEGALAGQWRMARLTLGLQLRAQTLTGGDSDVGTRTNRLLYQTVLTAKYDYSQKLSLSAELYENRSDYQRYLSSVEWVDQNWMDCEILPKLRLGAGLVLGDLSAQEGRRQTYEQGLLRLSRPASSKLSFSFNAGLEFRQFAGVAGSQLTPVFRGKASYRPADGTEILLESSRSNYSSALQAGQNYTDTGFSITLRQRLYQRFIVSLTGGYEDAVYEAPGAAIAASRQDRFYVARTGLAYALTQRMSISLYYQYRRNASTAAPLSFTDHVTGVQAALSF